MKILRKAGSTSNLLDVFISDSSSTTGAGLAGLLFSSAGLTAYYYREGAATSTAITLATMTLGTWATGGFIAIDGTNMPGCYQLGIPDAAFATGAKSCLIMLKGATNMAPLVIEVQLTSFDVDTAGVTVTTNNDKTGYALTQAFPANFSAFAITVGGAVTAGTVSDKTGYSLTQAFPANFSLLSINASGFVTYANDPWGVALPGTYGAGSAGYILGTNLNATVSSRSAPAIAQTIDLTTTVPAFTGVPATIGNMLYFCRQSVKNKLNFNKATNVMNLYEDDGITSKLAYAMTDDASNATRGAGA